MHGQKKIKHYHLASHFNTQHRILHTLMHKTQPQNFSSKKLRGTATNLPWICHPGTSPVHEFDRWNSPVAQPHKRKSMKFGTSWRSNCWLPTPNPPNSTTVVKPCTKRKRKTCGAPSCMKYSPSQLSHGETMGSRKRRYSHLTLPAAGSTGVFTCWVGRTEPSRGKAS
jgi:hypothetical protein